MDDKFEDFLQDEHFRQNPQVLDDDMQDNYEDWLTNLDNEELIEFGNKAMESITKKLQTK